MDNIYLYDEDFISLLNLIKYLLKNKLKPSNIKTLNYSPSLLEQTIYVDIENNDLIIEKMIEAFGEYAIRSIYYVFLSNEDDKELIIFDFICYAIKFRKKIMYYRNIDCVSKVLKISNYVMHECHKMKGFLRFKELENKVLYAEMEPTNDILFLVSCHFSKRLKNEYWIIKDNKRRILSIYDKSNFLIVSEDEFCLSTTKLSNDEKNIQSLWKMFYKTIGIAERKNDRCRRNFMPKKYWKYIIEVMEEL